MSDEIVNFNRERAERSRDAKLWSAEDALETLLEDVRAGRVAIERLAIHYLSPSGEDGRRYHGFLLAGADNDQHISLLTLALHTAMDDWRDG